ncbi:MAG: 1,4-beta-xylanase [Clostridiales Family XIII bacterium]|jgi:hypothetical protein|nr:1,4-beta-xylanase [Clostridiales Family XIII bacterium]
MTILPFIKGFTWRMVFSPHQTFAGEEAKESLRTLQKSTGIDTIILAFEARQETAHSEEIDYTGKFTPTDDEVTAMIQYAQSLELRVVLKPMLNCNDGTWRGFINFFDLDVPCEPKWSHWFANYTEYITHFAKVAEKTNCEMLIVGCEMVMTDRKESYWRDLIADVRDVYHGLLTYNCDKYQETEVKWWDAVDVISSSGYYPIKNWDENLDRIEGVLAQHDKPFFFAECGCPCVEGSADIPNDWTHKGKLSLEEQRHYYEVMFERCSARSWIRGFACWDWTTVYLYEPAPVVNAGYGVYGKPAADVIKDFYTQ